MTNKEYRELMSKTGRLIGTCNAITALGAALPHDVAAELRDLKKLIREEVLDEIYNQHGQNTALIERVRVATI